MVDPAEVRVVLLESGKGILKELDESLAQFAHRQLQKKGVEVRLNTRIRGATAEKTLLEDGSEVYCGTLVAAIGAAPNPLLEELPGLCDNRGNLIVDATLQVQGCPGLWALGDCAAVPDLVKGGTCPPTAQYAIRQAKQVAKNILTTVKGSAPVPFSHKNRGVFVPLGRFFGAAEIMGFKVAGFLAWWLYRTFYLYQLPQLERKLRVLIDWNLELFFHRDIVRQDVSRSELLIRACYEPGEAVFRQGELSQALYVIRCGEIEVSKEIDGLQIPVAALGPGEYFGEMSLLDAGMHTASAKALTSVDLLIMNGGDFKALAASSTQLKGLLDEVKRDRLTRDGNAQQVPHGATESTVLRGSETLVAR